MEWFQAFSIIFGVGAVVWWQISLTNKRIDDTTKSTNDKINDATNSTNAKISDFINSINKRIDDAIHSTNIRIDEVKDEIANHLRIDIKEIRKDGQERDKKMEELQRNMGKVLFLLEKMNKNH